MKNKYGSTDNLNNFSILLKGLQNTHFKDLKTKRDATEEILQTEPEHVLLAQATRLHKKVQMPLGIHF